MADDPKVRAATPLLQLITQQSLDVDYEMAAASRSADSVPPRRRLARTIGVTAVFGLLLAAAAIETSRNAEVTSGARDQLLARIDERQGVLERQRERVGDLRDHGIADDKASREVNSELAVVTAQFDRLAPISGWTEVEGSGLRIAVDDNEATGVTGMVLDSDLALLTNDLWASGATAIAVNDERLTALSAFRNSADVIRLNGVSLSPPYIFEVLGDQGRMRSELLQSSSGKLFSAMVQNVGLDVQVQNVNKLRLPAASPSSLQLRAAKPYVAESTPVSSEDSE